MRWTTHQQRCDASTIQPEFSCVNKRRRGLTCILPVLFWGDCLAMLTQTVMLRFQGTRCRGNRNSETGVHISQTDKQVRAYPTSAKVVCPSLCTVWASWTAIAVPSLEAESIERRDRTRAQSDQTLSHACISSVTLQAYRLKYEKCLAWNSHLGFRKTWCVSVNELRRHVLLNTKKCDLA